MVLPLPRLTNSNRLSGAEISVDGWAEAESSGKAYVIEARKHIRDGITQEAMMAIAFKIKHTGADGGFTVTIKEPQAGAKKIAYYEGIKSVVLYENSTREAWFSFINGVLKIGLHEEIGASVDEQVRIITKDEKGNVIDDQIVKGFGSDGST